MQLIEMNDDLRVGFSKIDEEHIELFKRINDLHGAIKEKRDASDIEMIFGFLEEYVITHFGMEERLMIKTSYPKFAQHREKHTYFIEEFIKIRNSFIRNKGSQDAWEYAQLMEILLKDWLIHHIKVFDKELGEFVV